MERRDDESFPEVLHDFLRHVPWWVGPIVIVVTFVVMYWAIPAILDVPKIQYDGSSPEKAMEMPKQIIGTVGAGLSRTFAPWVTLLVTVIWLFALASKYIATKKKIEGRGKSYRC